MGNEKLSFNKRISLVKKEVFENLKETKELDNIKGTDKTGFYSLSTIEKYLFPALDKQDLDLDLEIFSDKIIGHWYDCIEDKQRDIEIDFHRIENVEKLQLMANIVQSEGAVKSYSRRYALTAILRLPSTDLIETGDDFRKDNNGNNKNNSNNYNNGVRETRQSTGPNTTNTNKVNQKQLGRYFAIAKSKNIDVAYLDDLVKQAFNLQSKNDMLIDDYNNLTKFMSENDSQITINMLLKKIEKIGGKAPEKKS